jgi:PadR family transcriptional regulator, regulatory protein PadR
MSYSSEILRGNTETIILAILKHKDSYGYEIMKTIIERGKGLFNIKDATIYTAFKRMEKEGLISTYWGDEDGGPRRKYYTITSKGKDAYTQKVIEWKEINIVLNHLIGGEDNAK